MEVELCEELKLRQGQSKRSERARYRAGSESKLSEREVNPLLVYFLVENRLLLIVLGQEKRLMRIQSWGPS